MKADYIIKSNSFTQLLSSETFNTTSSSIFFVATPLVAITVLHANAMDVGILGAASIAAPLLFGLSAGAIADRLDRRKILLWCSVSRLFLVGILPILFYFGQGSIASLCIVSFGVSTIKLIFDTVLSAVVPIIVPREHLTKANSWYEAINSTAYTLGPAIAGWLTQTVSISAVYAINAILYLISTFFVKKIVLPSAPPLARQRKSHIGDIADGIRLLWKNEIQRTVALAAGSFNLFHTAFFTVFTICALKELGFSAASFGTIISAVGLAGLLGALCAPKLIDLIGVRAALVGTLIVIGPLGLPILFAGNLPFSQRTVLIAFCLAAWDFLIVVHVIIEQTIRQTMIENNQLSRLTATIRFVSWGVDPVGALLGGIAASSFLGSNGTLLICMFGFMASGALLLISKGIRNLSTDDFRAESEHVPNS
jgi:predicted MFS family arabinose efflux permease